MTEAGGIPLGLVAAAANRRDDGLLAATLDTLAVVGVLLTQPLVHLDAAYDYQPLPAGAGRSWHGRRDCHAGTASTDKRPDSASRSSSDWRKSATERLPMCLDY